MITYDMFATGTVERIRYWVDTDHPQAIYAHLLDLCVKHGLGELPTACDPWLTSLPQYPSRAQVFHVLMQIASNQTMMVRSSGNFDRPELASSFRVTALRTGANRAEIRSQRWRVTADGKREAVK